MTHVIPIPDTITIPINLFGNVDIAPILRIVVTIILVPLFIMGGVVIIGLLWKHLLGLYFNRFHKGFNI